MAVRIMRVVGAPLRLIVFLAVVVGSIVIAMFLPLMRIANNGFEAPTNGAE